MDWHDPRHPRKRGTSQGKDVTALLKCLEDPGLRSGLSDPAGTRSYEEQALAVYRAVHGDDEPARAASHHDLAKLLVQLRNEERGRSHFETALAIRREVLGEDHPDTARTLFELGIVCYRQRNYAQARATLEEALALFQKTLGEGHHETVLCLANLSGLLMTLDDPLAAQTYSKVVKYRGGEAEKARALTTLGDSVWSSGNPSAARIYFEQALAICRQSLGEDHPDTVASLERMGGLLEYMRDFVGALAYYEQVLAIRRRVPKSELPPLFLSSVVVAFQTANHDMLRVADLCVATNRVADAWSLMLEILANEDRLIREVFTTSHETRRAFYLKYTGENLARFLSVLLLHFESSPLALASALDVVLRRKALAVEALAAQRDALLEGRYPQLQPILRALSALRTRIARKALAGPGSEGLETHRRDLADWTCQRQELEFQLAQTISELGLEQKLRAADRRAVARALPEGSALVEFVRVPLFDFHAGTFRFSQPWKPDRYLAFLLPASEPDNVQLLDLGETAAIDRLINDFRAGITGEVESRVVVLSARQSGADSAAGDRLRAALFDPLADALGGCRHVFLSPDGDLNRLPFGALPTADGRRLLDSYRVSYVSVGRDLLRFRPGPGRQSAKAVVAAAPDFDLRTEAGACQTGRPGSTKPAPRRGFWGRLFGRRQAAPMPGPVPELAAHPAPALPSVGRVSRDLGRGRIHFSPLPGTRVEGERIARRLGVAPLMGPAALKGRLKVLRSPRILHLATHGFFLSDQQPDLNRFGRNLELLGPEEAAGLRHLSGPGVEDPMLRSGLALAGANTFLQGSSLIAEAEDGLLTAEDVAGLDLLDTELVVLSACDTGLGAVQAGEGVFGLRRAFIVAGARTLVMSLWKVPDLATAFLMDRFYDNLLGRGLDRDLALSEAQRATREVTVGRLRAEWLSAATIDCLAGGDAGARRDLEELARQPDHHRPFEHPFYWGAFICQGDTAPLPGSEPTPQ